MIITSIWMTDLQQTKYKNNTLLMFCSNRMVFSRSKRALSRAKLLLNKTGNLMYNAPDYSSDYYQLKLLFSISQQRVLLWSSWNFDLSCFLWSPAESSYDWREMSTTSRIRTLLRSISLRHYFITDSLRIVNLIK